MLILLELRTRYPEQNKSVGYMFMPNHNKASLNRLQGKAFVLEVGQ